MHPGFFTTAGFSAPLRAAALICLACFSQALLAQVSDGEGLTPLEGVVAISDDRALWDSVKDSRDVNELQAYLAQFPKGLFAAVAAIRIRALGGAGSVAVPQVAPTAQQKVAPGTIIKDCADCPEMVVIPAGSFTMGSSAAEQALANSAGVAANITSRENPQHRVNIRSFAAGRYAISKGEFATFVRAKGYQTEAERGDGCFAWNGKEYKKDAAYNWRNVGFAQADNHPVVCVSWNDAQAYIAWLNQSSGQTYRLLSEAEREYAAREGTQTAFWWGDSINTAQANYGGTGTSYNGSPKGEWRQATVPVNSFSPNPFGLYNVHGNVWEWVEDCFNDNYTGAPTDGSAWTTGDCRYRVLRGGSWSNFPAILRSANRGGDAPGNRGSMNGLRLARTLGAVSAPIVEPAPIHAPSPSRAGQIIKDCADCPEMVVLPAGSFEMGSPPDPRPEPSSNAAPKTIGSASEKPQRRVQIASFAIGKYEVTQEQWYAVMGANPSSNKGRTLPVEQVSWADVQVFIQKLNQKTGQQYRLPSEAEWEYAARAGSQAAYSFGDDEKELDRYAWYRANSGRQTHPVGEKRPNAFGLFDTHGNVWEWVEDCWHDNYTGAPTDGSAWTTGCSSSSRVLRGGSWFDHPADLRSGNRFRFTPDFRFIGNGLRLARTP